MYDFSFSTLLFIAAACLTILFICAFFVMPSLLGLIKSIFFPQEPQSGRTLLETPPKYSPPHVPEYADALTGKQGGVFNRNAAGAFGSSVAALLNPYPARILPDLPNDIYLGDERETGKPLYLPEKTLTQGLLTIGPPGRGKTYTINQIIEQLIAHGNNALVIFDGQKAETGTYISYCLAHNRKFTVVPMGNINPLNASAVQVADVFAQTSEIGQEGDGHYYSLKCQMFIKTVLPLFRRAYGMPITIDDLMLLCKTDEARQELLQKAPPCKAKFQYNLHFRGWKQNPHFEKALETLVMWLDRIPYDEKLSYYLNHDRHAKTLAQLIEERQIIIIRAGANKTNNYERALGLLFMIAVQDYVNHRDPNNLPFFLGVFLDEAPMYFNKAFPDFMNQYRKMRTSVCLGCQSFEQLEENRAQILSGSQTWMVQPGLFESDARQVSMQIGERLFEVTQKSKSERSGETTSYSVSATQIREPLWHPYHIQNLNPNHFLCLTVIERQNYGPFEIVKPPSKQFEPFRYREPDVPEEGELQTVFNVSFYPEEEIDQQFYHVRDSQATPNQSQRQKPHTPGSYQNPPKPKDQKPKGQKNTSREAEPIPPPTSNNHDTSQPLKRGNRRQRNQE